MSFRFTELQLNVPPKEMRCETDWCEAGSWIKKNDNIQDMLIKNTDPFNFPF